MLIQPVSGELVENHMRIQLYETRRNINKFGKPVNIDECYPSTSYQYILCPTENSFVLLAGILHETFFSLNDNDAEHYGGIGFVIGHEIGHGFDDQGSRFDGEGNLVHWWTKEDAKAYNNVIKRLDRAG